MRNLKKKPPWYPFASFTKSIKGLIFALTAFSAHLKNVAQAMIDARYPINTEADEDKVENKYDRKREKITAKGEAKIAKKVAKVEAKVEAKVAKVEAKEREKMKD